MAIKSKTHLFDQSSLYRLVRRRRLAELVGLSDAQLRHVTKYADTLYREFEMPKKNGSGNRQIEDPKKLLKDTQSRLAKILSRITPPDFLFCPVKQRSYITNAAQHKANRVVRSLDIHKYFPSTTSHRVFWFFNSMMECERDIAGTLTRIACYKEHLPTGSPLSPILSFFAHYDMWKDIADKCNQEGLTLTVYIDDITISGDKVTKEFIWKIKKAISRNGLSYHKEKAFFDQPAEVTGVYVSKRSISAPYKQFKKLRLGLEAVKRSSENHSAEAQAKLNGLKQQLSQIHQISVSGSAPSINEFPPSPIHASCTKPATYCATSKQSS
jgi:Reverse transcriptase (RNA-dependent DNA polymerase)